MEKMILPDPPDIQQMEHQDKRKFSVVPLAMLRDRTLTPTAKVIMCVFCSYCNKAGITHVSQAKVASDLQIDQSRVSRAMANLKRKGYIEYLGKPCSGIKGRTLRVIYDPEITAEDAIAIAGTAAEDDLRPEQTRIEEHAELLAMAEEREWTAEELRANKERLAGMLVKAFKTSADTPKLYNPVKGDTLAVKKAKQEIRARMRQMRAAELSESKDRTEDNDMHYAHTNRKKIRLYDNSAYDDNAKTEICTMSIQSANRLDYEAIVVLFEKELKNGVKTETDLDMCMRLSERGVTRDVIMSHVHDASSDTVRVIADRILGTEY